MRRIIFVCTGNTCRSPMAEALFNSKVENDSSLRGEFVASSAGIFVDPYMNMASTEAINVMQKEYNIDISKHIPTKISPKMIEEAELVLCVGEDKVLYLKRIVPENVSMKIYNLKTFVGLSGNIEDPFGGDYDLYKRCANEIDEIIVKLIEKLKLNKKGESK